MVDVDPTIDCYLTPGKSGQKDKAGNQPGNQPRRSTAVWYKLRHS